jgi:hypothetical protein
MMAPRLWGSSISSQRIKKGSSPFSSAFAKRSDISAYSKAAAIATTP